MARQIRRDDRTPHVEEAVRDGEQRRSLRGVRIFGALSNSERRDIEARCRWRRYQPEEHVFEAGSTGDEIFHVIEGELAIQGVGESGREVQFATVSPGDSVGEMSAIDRHARSASLIATTDCLLAVMHANEFTDAILAHSSVGLALLVKMASIVRAGDERILEFGLLQTKSKVYDRLCQLAVPDPRTPDLWSIRPLPALSQIGRHVGATREQVAEAFLQLYPRRIVERRDDCLYVLDLEALRELSH